MHMSRWPPVSLSFCLQEEGASTLATVCQFNSKIDLQSMKVSVPWKFSIVRTLTKKTKFAQFFCLYSFILPLLCARLFVLFAFGLILEF